MEQTSFDEEFGADTRDLGWKPLTTGNLTIFDIPGDHLSILESPNVQVMAEKLQWCLDGTPLPDPLELTPQSVSQCIKALHPREKEILEKLAQTTLEPNIVSQNELTHLLTLAGFPSLR